MFPPKVIYNTNEIYVFEFANSRRLCNDDFRGTPLAAGCARKSENLRAFFNPEKEVKMLGLKPMQAMLRSGRCTHLTVFTDRAPFFVISLAVT